MRIALTGNPNSGKTTMYNALTGRTEKVGNWAGVTVDKKEWEIKKGIYSGAEKTIAVDLPGAYSMSPFTSEENVTRGYVINENPDVIVNIVDSTNLSRSLFFTTQLLELGVPVVIALNKSDVNVKKQNEIDVEKLSQLLGCAVVNTVAVSSDSANLTKLVETAVSAAGSGQTAPFDVGSYDPTNKEAVKNADKKRYEFVKDIVSKVETRTTKTSDSNFQDGLDKILAHKWLGLPIFAVVMYCVFAISQTYVGPPIADLLVGWIEGFQEMVGTALGEDVSPLLYAILVNGIIGGVGAVVGFLPLIMVMFFLLALLEECGYMARVAVVMDRFFKVVGLSGKSIIPMVIGIACGIPGVMATRTIKNERERRTTALLTPFMPCGAKLPVIALFAGVFFDSAAWVNTLMYFLGIALIFVGAWIIQRITGEKNAKSFFIIELPEYSVPSLWRATLSMLDRGKSFVIKAATIILVCNAAVEIMGAFDMSFNLVAEGMEHTSILATIASPVAFLLAPLGFGMWQLAAAAVTGFIAKENVVGTLAVVYGISNFINEDLEVVGGQGEIASIMGITSLVAMSYLIFNLFTPPCFACIGAMNAEMEDRKWLLGGIAFQFGTGYVMAFFVYQIGMLLTVGTLGDSFITGLIITAALLGYLVYLVQAGNKKADEKIKSTVAKKQLASK